ncbi:hypothetical protein OTK51_11445 [Vibrio scophthalmi]|uniref:hypothetical protein n=1 Tax=Vibrio scophthalmi TaxID=45658 RepID=UPI002283DBF2|nr:hypothetical protein [Vibrio scophthalmi]MCY9804043.1 hypothetical protein [Vibrio scophthalmi]
MAMKINKLVFQKVSASNPIAGVGTAGNVWIVLNSLLNIDKKERLYVDMETNKTINNEREKIFDTYNAWEYYFDQNNLSDSDVNFIDYHNIKSRIHYDKYYTSNDNICVILRELFWNNFKLKKYLKDEIELFCFENLANKITLGVQIRLTDMSSNHNVEKFNAYVKRVNNILRMNKEIEQVFLATDDETIITEFSESVTKPVIYIKDIYRATENKKDLNPYDRCQYVRPKHLYLLGKEVLLDVFILSRCQYILKAEVSAVSQLAVIFSEKTPRVFFMKSKFINDLKFVFIGAKSLIKKVLRND